MNVSRRGFLGTLATALAGAAYDPELLLWKPGAKTIVDMGGVVPFGGCQFLTIDAITRESLRLLKEKLTLLNRVYDSAFVDGAKIGTVINVRKPQRFVLNVEETMAQYRRGKVGSGQAFDFEPGEVCR